VAVTGGYYLSVVIAAAIVLIGVRSLTVPQAAAAGLWRFLWNLMRDGMLTSR
jgi:hypothetical protein